jgi:hypothetical protein
MPGGARRQPARPWRRLTRRALQPLRPWLAGAALCLAGTGAATSQTVVAATYDEPTTRYGHAVLGDAVEWGALVLTLSDGTRRRLRLPETRVFEDTAPRLADLDGDGAPEVIVVESDIALGARLSVYGADGLIAATPHIGRTHRWLAPLGAADLDGDGRVEIAYIDRPHLARTLRVWRFEDGALRPVADLAGLTNHRIGETDIAGGIRDCGQGPEIVAADAGWTRLMAVTLVAGVLAARDIGPHRDRASFAAALACRY